MEKGTALIDRKARDERTAKKGSQVKSFSTQILPVTEIETRDEDRRRFWNMLATVVPKTGFTASDRGTTVLDIACGACIEGSVLESYFGGQSFGESNEAAVKVVGVDTDSEKIEQAKYAYRLRKNFAFHIADATRLDENADIPVKADVVIIRNQQIHGSDSYHDPDLWPQIFTQALEHVTDEGIVLITSCLDAEHQTAIEALRERNCAIVVDQENEFAMPFNENLSRDKWVTVVKKS